MTATSVPLPKAIDHGTGWQWVADAVTLSAVYRFSVAIEGDNLPPPSYAYIRYADSSVNPSPNVDLPCIVTVDPQGNGQTQYAIGVIGGAIPPQTTQLSVYMAKPNGAGNALGGRLFIEP